MVFPGLLAAGARSSGSRSQSRSGPDLEPQHEYIYDEAQLPALPPERPDLRELNNCLEALAAVFPDVQVEVFRELLSNFDGESRLALAADAILKNRAAWVKGRWKVPDRSTETSELVSDADVFRSDDYKNAVQSMALQEFKGLSKSTINAVLAESNYSYLEARKTLVTLSTKSWRFTLSSLFMRRKPIASGEAENHPLVTWRSTGQGSIIPTIQPTGSAELDRELYKTLIAPLRARDRQERETKDRCLAVLLNNEEAEEAGATHECTCCFGTGPFEEFTQCNREGHMICFRCVQHSVKEALFGQGWQSSINPETGTLRCIAVDGDECSGLIPFHHMRRAMLDDDKGASILHKLDQRLAEHSLVASRLPLIRCPFCSYAEIDDIYMPAHEARLRVRADSLCKLLLLLLCLLSLPLIFPVILLSSLVCFLVSRGPTVGQSLMAEWKQAIGRHRRRRRGMKFSCRNPECARPSCLSCNKAWTDIHVCNESSLVALRTQVEQAMSMAIKRVCPRCNTSFVKNAGCNKLTCPCGYKMCYVCRSDLGDEGYRHFCDHFRPDGDPRPCKECDRCNLWESEDSEEVLREAREEAERKWKLTEKRDLSGAEKSFLETGFASRDSDSTFERILSCGKLPTLPELFDSIIETIFV
ncbi:E3 ubiquitin-protein ligase RNF216 [Paramyrothecium foliicola]|nr:E3 ubiquitin-protein ligase RNF216 [Paramyrothecium foliicola]